MTGFVADWMKPAYPEMLESIDRVARVVARRGAPVREHLPGRRARVPR